MTTGDYQTALCLKIIHEHFGIITKVRIMCNRFVALKVRLLYVLFRCRMLQRSCLSMKLLLYNY